MTGNDDELAKLHIYVAASRSLIAKQQEILAHMGRGIELYFELAGRAPLDDNDRALLESMEIKLRGMAVQTQEGLRQIREHQSGG